MLRLYVFITVFLQSCTLTIWAVPYLSLSYQQETVWVAVTCSLTLKFLYDAAASGLPGVAAFDAESELQDPNSPLEELMAWELTCPKRGL